MSNLQRVLCQNDVESLRGERYKGASNGNDVAEHTDVIRFLGMRKR